MNFMQIRVCAVAGSGYTRFRSSEYGMHGRQHQGRNISASCKN